MDLSAPYATVIPSLDGPVLEVLARAGRPLTGRQVQRLARRGSVPGVASVLDRLSDTGIVAADRVGSSILYRANRDHLAWPAVEVLVEIRATLMARIADAIRAWGRTPVQAVLFGSAARGDGGTDSDIDILLVHADGLPPTDEELAELRSDIVRWTGNHAQVVVVADATWRDMAKKGDPLADSVARDGIDLLGAPEPVA